jgi:formylglycine-generating enzyme required for sulfatase activity
MGNEDILKASLSVNIPSSSWSEGEVSISKATISVTGPAFSESVEMAVVDKTVPISKTFTNFEPGTYNVHIDLFDGEQRVVSAEGAIELAVGQVNHVYFIVAGLEKADEFEPLPNSFMGQLRSKTGLRFDLPTEAQWEYACRAGTEMAYHNGLDCTFGGTDFTVRDPNLDSMAWYGADWPGEESGIGTREVGLKQSSAWGLYDMHGNVWEMCLDWYGEYEGDAIDPLGPASGMKRVAHGGSWHTWASLCRSAQRMPAKAGRMAGLRLTCSAQDIEPSYLYMMVDVSEGPQATAYPVTYLDTEPTDLLTNDACKMSKIVLRRIPAGRFVMGSPENEIGRDANEKQHLVTLTQDFYIGVFPVTQGQWKRVMGSNPSFYQNSEKLPVENVSWEVDMRGGNWPPREAKLN